MKHRSRKKHTLRDAEQCFLPIFLLFGLEGAHHGPGFRHPGQLYAPPGVGVPGAVTPYGAGIPGAGAPYGAAPYGPWGANPALRWIV